MSFYTIMVVDDNEGDQFLCQHAIHTCDADIIVLQAYDGKQALDMLETETPDILFLDISMPGMDGFEFLTHYSKKFPDRSTKVVMLTSSVIQKDQTRSWSFGVIEHYIEKPLQPGTLVKLINDESQKR